MQHQMRNEAAVVVGVSSYCLYFSYSIIIVIIVITFMNREFGDTRDLLAPD